MKRNTTAILAGVGMFLFGVPMVVGQETKPAEPAPDPLAGPTVKETKEERSLIRRNFEGRIQRLETLPDEAAVELLSLDEAVKARVRAVLDDYNKTLDRLVTGNLDLLVKFTNTTGRRERFELVREAKTAFADLESKGSLKERVAKELPKEQAERYETLVKGYWEVLIDDAVQQTARESKDREKSAGRGEIVIREGFLAFGQEVKRSYERQISAKTKELEAFLKKLDLSTEKETKIRNMFVDFEERTKGVSRPEQRRELATRVFRELNKEQQRTMLEELFKTPPTEAPGTAPEEGMKDSEPMEPMKER